MFFRTHLRWFWNVTSSAGVKVSMCLSTEKNYISWRVNSGKELVMIPVCSFKPHRPKMETGVLRLPMLYSGFVL